MHRLTVIELRMNDEDGKGTGCFGNQSRPIVRIKYGFRFSLF